MCTFKVILHNFSKIKVIKKSQDSRNQCFSYNFCLMIERSGSVSLTNGSGRPNIWILRIRISLGPDLKTTGGPDLPRYFDQVVPCEVISISSVLPTQETTETITTSKRKPLGKQYTRKNHEISCWFDV